jgi:hypothetical protein
MVSPESQRSPAMRHSKLNSNKDVWNQSEAVKGNWTNRSYDGAERTVDIGDLEELYQD